MSTSVKFLFASICNEEEKKTMFNLSWKSAQFILELEFLTKQLNLWKQLAYLLMNVSL